MNHIFPIFVVSALFLYGCTSNLSHKDHTDHIVTISDTTGYAVGRGVLFQENKLITATHVFRECEKVECQYRLKSGKIVSIDSMKPEIRGDRILISVVPLSPSRLPIEYEEPLVMMPIYALVSRSGSWARIDGKILALDEKYIVYDKALSGRVFTGGIETDIILEKGESGTPIWSLSGGLIGVMSAVEREGKRSWIVR